MNIPEQKYSVEFNDGRIKMLVATEMTLEECKDMISRQISPECYFIEKNRLITSLQPITEMNLDRKYTQEKQGGRKMITDDGRKRKSFLEKHFYQPEKKEITFQDFADQLIIPPSGPSVLVMQKKRENEMKEKEKKSLTDAVKDIAGRVDKLEGKSEEKMSVRKFEQEMIRKSNKILNSEEKISQTDASIIESTVRLIGHTFGVAGFEQYNDEYLAELEISEDSK